MLLLLADLTYVMVTDLCTVLTAAKMGKENAAASTNKPSELMGAEKQTAQSTVDKDEEQVSCTVSSQSTSSGEGQSGKEKESIAEKGEETNVEKTTDEKMEVDPHPETVASSDNKGRWLELFVSISSNYIIFIFGFLLFLFFQCISVFKHTGTWTNAVPFLV